MCPTIPEKIADEAKRSGNHELIGGLPTGVSSTKSCPLYVPSVFPGKQGLPQGISSLGVNTFGGVNKV